jgi:hypothetical protein
VGSAKPPTTYAGKTLENEDTVYTGGNAYETNLKKNRFGGLATVDYTKDRLTVGFRGEFVVGQDEYLIGPSVDSTDTRNSQAYFAHVELLQCNSCHEERTTRKLALKSPGEQKEVIREMLVKSGSKADQEEIERLHRSYQQLLGF